MTDTVVSAGQTSSGFSVNSGDTFTISNGGLSISATVSTGGFVNVSAGGTAYR